jgi:hypothetical protein
MSSAQTSYSIADVIAFLICCVAGFLYVEKLKGYKTLLLSRELPSIIKAEYYLGAEKGKEILVAGWPADAHLIDRTVYGIFVGILFSSLYSLRYLNPKTIASVTLRLGPLVHLFITIVLPLPGFCRLESIYEGNLQYIFVGEFSSLIWIHMLIQIGVLFFAAIRGRINCAELFLLIVFWSMSMAVTDKFFSATPFVI